MTKLFVFDCDGTLINDHREIDQKNIDAINNAISLGHKVCLCTGRNYFQLEKYLVKMPGIETVGSLNGACIHDVKNNKILKQGQPLSKELIDDVVRIAKETKREIHWTNTNQKMFRVYFGNSPKEDITDPSFFKVGTINPVYDDWEQVKHNLYNEEIIQISVKIEYSKVLPYYEFLKQKYHDTRKNDITLSSKVYVDITPVNCNKFNAVKFFQEYYHINEENTYCFGDSDNDILMIKNSLNGIAMSNCTPIIRYYSRWIIGDNNSTTIANTINDIIKYKYPFKQLEPSLLSFDVNKIKQSLTEAINVGIDCIHYDVMDEYVNNKSFDNEWLELIHSYGLKTTIHFMVYDPITWINRFMQFNPFAITFQFEPLSYEKVIACLDEIKKNYIKAGIAIKPSSDFKQYECYLDKLDIVTIMSVEPGKGGQSFIKDSLKNLIDVFNYRKQHNLKYLIQVDGGIKLDNVKEVLSYADNIISGTGYINLDDHNKKLFINTIKEINN